MPKIIPANPLTPSKYQYIRVKYRDSAAPIAIQVALDVLLEYEAYIRANGGVYPISNAGVKQLMIASMKQSKTNIGGCMNIVHKVKSYVQSYNPGWKNWG